MEVPPIYPIKNCVADAEIGTNLVENCEYYEKINNAIQFNNYDEFI